MSASDDDRTASLMTPAKLAQLKARPAPAASPAAWLDQMAADAGSGHVRRLAELRQQLEASMRAGEGDLHPVAASCQALQDALARIDFDLVQPKGWIARAVGKGKEAAAGFAQQHARMLRAADDLVDEVKGLAKKQPARAALDRTVLEVEAEVRALEKIMDQGARWLQDMRNQLKAREAQGGDAAVQQQIREDTRRCELLVERLKLLRGVTAPALQALERCKGALAKRAAVLAGVQQVLEAEWKAARQKVTAVAEEAAGSGSATEGVASATRARDAAQSALQQAAQDCGAVQAVEQGAADELAALQGPLRAAA